MTQQRFIVTGGSNGIGAQVVQRLIHASCDVIVLDREPTTTADWLALDLSDPHSIDAVAAALTGPFDGLINCAGIAPRPDNQFDVLAINWLGTRQLTEQIRPKLADGASVVTLASRAGAQWADHLDVLRPCLPIRDIDGLRAQLRSAEMTEARAYELSKELLIVWTMQESASDQGIRFNTVSPSSVDTRLSPDFKAAFQGRATQNRSLVSRVATVAEVAAAVCFLASREASWINGVDLKVDGGITAKRLLQGLAL